MIDPIARAKALVSALGATTRATLSNAAREAEWQRKKSSLSQARFEHVMQQLKALGLGEVPTSVTPELPETRYEIILRCEFCSDQVETPVDGGEVEARADLYRYVIRRPMLHLDIDSTRSCYGLLTPIGIWPIHQ